MLILDDYVVEQTGTVRLDLTFEVYVTAEQAKLAASQWAQDEITMHLIGKTPTFVLFTSDTGYEAIWRVPLELALYKHIYPVTTIDVSATTGQVVDPDRTKQRILDVLEEDVRPLAEQHSFVRPEISQEYLAQFDPSSAAIAP